ncbi:unnamed protein product [Rhizophagus irregularis]|nr:unnamed protein product [Rhizophagus irregularis]
MWISVFKFHFHPLKKFLIKIPPTSTVTVSSRAREFSEDFFADNGKLMPRFCDHIDAFVTADIPLEKIDKLQNWLRENCNEGGFIPKSDTLRRDYLPKLFEDHVNQLKEYFREVEKYVTYHIFNVKEYLIQKIYLYLITTRWNTWFRMAFHVYQNLDYIRGFYNEEGKENSMPIIEKINSAFTDQQINGAY